MEYMPIGDVLDFMKNQQDYSKVYKTRGKKSAGSGINNIVVVDQEIPESLQADVLEPNVTN